MATKKEIKNLLAADTEKLRDALKEAGYTLTKAPERLVTKTFRFDAELIASFYKACNAEGLKYQDGLDQAIRDWLRKKS